VKKEDKKKVLLYLARDEVRWNELLSKLPISEATLHRYLKELVNEDRLEKKIGPKGNIVYSSKEEVEVVNQRLHEIHDIEEQIKNLEQKKNEIVQDLF
jgi:DNA-binding HxlR family transcriptional regulator